MTLISRLKVLFFAYALYSLVTVIFAFPAGFFADKLAPHIVYAMGLMAFANCLRNSRFHN
jgi:hypothetical protein